MIANHGRAFFAFVCILGFAVVAAAAAFVKASVLPDLDVDIILSAGQLVVVGGTAFIVGERTRDTAATWKGREPQVEPRPAQDEVATTSEDIA